MNQIFTPEDRIQFATTMSWKEANVFNKVRTIDATTESIKKVVLSQKSLSDEQQNLLSVAYKNSIEPRRSNWRVFQSIVANKEGSEEKQQLAGACLVKFDEELRDICNDVLELLDNYLIPNVSDKRSYVFYLKMKGDYLGYLTEVATDKDRSDYVKECVATYEMAMGVDLDLLEPLRFAVAYNFFLFYREILNAPDKACQLAKRVVDQIDGVDGIGMNLHSGLHTLTIHILDALRLYVQWFKTDDQDAGGETGETGGN
uniref:14-3-3 domain-containing protein n=1 Tax=Panagrolaimus sp. JU765 TaxID=591449 RepID=A0AC34RA37_9BILA